MRIPESNSDYGNMSLRAIVVTCAMSFSLILFFQNCGAPVNEAGINTGASITLDTFPYDFKMGHVAHLSCAKNDATNSLGWSYKVGSIDDKFGLGLSTEFLSANANRTSGSVKERLKNSIQGQSILVLGNRAAGGINASEQVDGKDFRNTFSTFTSNEAVLAHVAPLSLGEYANFFEDVDLSIQANDTVLEKFPYRFQTTLPTFTSTIGSLDLELTFHSAGADGNIDFGTALENPKVPDQVVSKSFIPVINGSSQMTEVEIGPDSLVSCFSLRIHMNQSTAGNDTSCEMRPDEDNANSALTAAQNKLILDNVAMIREIIDPDNDEWWISIGTEAISGKPTGCVFPKKANLCENKPTGGYLSICLNNFLN